MTFSLLGFSSIVLAIASIEYQVYWALKVFMTPDLEAKLEMCVKVTRPLQHTWCWTRRVLAAQGLKSEEFERQFLTGKVILVFRDKALMDPIQKKCSCCLGLLVVEPKDQQLVLFSLHEWKKSNFVDKGSPDHKPKYICTK